MENREQGMSVMIDIHCHILPNVDAGPQSVTASLEMAKQALAQGVHTVVAAPSYLNGFDQNEKAVVLEHVRTYERLLAAHDIPLQILPGQHIQLTAELPEAFVQDKLLTINDNGKYLLLACPEGEVPMYVENMLYDMQLKGLIPIISSPERNAHILAKPDLIYQLVKKGALVQLGAKSLLGAYGTKVKKFALQLLKANLAHVLATEAASSTTGNDSLKAAYAEIGKKVGTEKVYMLQENAHYIIEGQMVHREQPVRIEKKRFGIF